MSETGFQIFVTVFPAAEDLVYAASLALFLRLFMREQETYRFWKTDIVFFAHLFIDLLCQWTNAPQGTFVLLLTGLLTALSGALGLERPVVFLLALLYWSTKNASGLIVQSLDFIVDWFWLAPAADVPEEIFLRSAVLLTLLLVSHAVLLAVMLWAPQRRLRRMRPRLQAGELCYLSLVPLSGMLFGYMITRLLFEMKDGVLLRLYERHPAFLAIVPLLALLSYAGTWLGILLQRRMDALREEQAAHYAEYQQIQAIRARIREMERFYTQIRQLKHNMRGHLTSIKGLARSGQYDRLEAYISQVDSSIGSFELALQTGDPVTDVIVNDKRQRSLELGIRFQADFHCQSQGPYDAFDLGIILQNLLQNALEACEKVPESQRFITLTGRRKGRFFLIEVRNSFTGEVIFGRDGLPVTTKKENTPMHGIGLASVRREAEKYMGELELKAERNEFSATVLLQERSEL